MEETMRNVIAEEFISLEGVIENAKELTSQYVSPEIVGHGTRLFGEGDEPRFELIESRPLAAGAGYLSFAPNAAVRTGG
jgi:hypothetical protein